LIEGFVRRAEETEAPLLATQLRRYAASEGQSWDELAHSLGGTAEALHQVALCGPPRAEHFGEDVAAIAADHVDADRLLALLRQIQVLGAFRGFPAVSSTRHASAGHGMLLAARDKEEPEEVAEVAERRNDTEADADETGGLDDDAEPADG
jgi:hypothetical protein